jgi:rhamnosyl/mannosyltransferase
VYYKGIEVLAKAIEHVDANFVVIGKGPSGQALKELQKKEALSSRLHLIDYVDDDELIAWYHAADILTLPSVETSEAFGLVQIEAHAASTPAVSSRLKSGVPYANLDGVTGLCFPPKDSNALIGALNLLIEDKDLRMRLGKQAQERALGQFNIPQMIDAVTCVYREAIELKSGDDAIKCKGEHDIIVDQNAPVDRANVDGV